MLEDESKKPNHSLFKRIIDEDRTGEVIEEGKTLYLSGWWVKFYYGKILLKEDEVFIIDTD